MIATLDTITIIVLQLTHNYFAWEFRNFFLRNYKPNASNII